MKYKTIFSQLTLLIAIIFFSMFVFSIISIVFFSLILDIPFSSFTDVKLQDFNGNNTIYLQLMNFIVVLGTFVFPVFLFFIIQGRRRAVFGFVQINRGFDAVFLVIIILIIFIAFPFVEWLINWNANIKFPDSLSWLETWMIEKENNTKEITRAFLQMDNIFDFIVTSFFVAVIPAIVEEFFFRGFLQNFLYGWTKSINISILLTALLFSAIHLQFYGFFPRLWLGLLFGYLFYWSKSLWIPIIAHFINNFSAILVTYISGKNITEIENKSDMSTIPNITVIISFSITIIIVFLLHKYYSKKNDKVKNTDKVINGWLNIYSNTDEYKARILSDKLNSEGIEAVLMNHQDSSYKMFGEFRVYVKPENEDIAKKIVENYAKKQI